MDARSGAMSGRTDLRRGRFQGRHPRLARRQTCRGARARDRLEPHRRRERRGPHRPSREPAHRYQVARDIRGARRRALAPGAPGARGHYAAQGGREVQRAGRPAVGPDGVRRSVVQPSARRPLRFCGRDAATRHGRRAAEALQRVSASRGAEGATSALPARARHLWQRRRVRPVSIRRLHQAVGDGAAHGGASPGTAACTRPGQAARRRQEAHAIAKKAGKLWGGRFKRPLLPELERFSSSLAIDYELYPYDIAGSLAHARGLAAAGILSTRQLAAIGRGLRQIKGELDSDKFDFKLEDEDIHTAIERRLTEITPAGAALHAGRSRNDQVALDLRLYSREAAVEAVSSLVTLIVALAKKAADHADWLMPGYTHLQRAQPITVGHHLLAHAEPLLRDLVRFVHAFESANSVPLGSGALAGTTLPIDRRVAAKELGMADLSPNSVDAVSDRDFALELAFACVSVATHLSRLGAAVVIVATSEFGPRQLAND